MKRDDEVIEIGEYGSFVRGSRYYTNLEDPIVPSGASEQAWLQMNIGEPKLFKDRQCTGKWLVFKPMSFVDAIWPILKKSLSDGKLGFAMKASTSDSREKEGNALVCIYTENWLDIKDIVRVLGGLRDIGIDDRLYYKADQQTLSGVKGSIYCSPSGTAIEITSKGLKWYALSHEELPKLDENRKIILL